MTVRELIRDLEQKNKTLENEVSRLKIELEDMMMAKAQVERELSEAYLQKTELEQELNTMKAKKSRKKPVEPEIVEQEEV